MAAVGLDVLVLERGGPFRGFGAAGEEIVRVDAPRLLATGQATVMLDPAGGNANGTRIIQYDHCNAGYARSEWSTPRPWRVRRRGGSDTTAH